MCVGELSGGDQVVTFEARTLMIQLLKAHLEELASLDARRLYLLQAKLSSLEGFSARSGLGLSDNIQGHQLPLDSSPSHTPSCSNF